MRRALAGWTALTLWVALAAPAAADQTRVYHVRWRIDVPVLAIAAAAGGAAQWMHESRTTCPCDPALINSFDRRTAGHRSRVAAHASDLMAAVMIAGPYLADAADLGGDHDSHEAWRDDATVFAEATALDMAVNDLVRRATHRARPLLYGLPAGDPAYATADNYRSFYSVHTSASFAAAMSWARTYAYRHPNDARKWRAYAAAGIGSGIVGALRIKAGEHFPTDVITGAIAGTVVGLVVPALHR